ncbi:1-phosphofructokinase family hexose kinase [Ornithinimicrobium sp. LYQ92]|uniref:1-phosphofructokinase family hexose kinase n=1 Tax=Serinicoccus sp. LYQ92 TaxID=3378798 RepID=UPI003853FD5A
MSGRPILVITLNPALDVTYPVASLRPGDSHRVTSRLSERAGGKGINVAQVLHRAGRPVLVTGVVGGDVGARITTDLDVAGIPQRLVRCADSTRRTVTVVETDRAHRATVLNEPGPTITGAEWSSVVDRVTQLLPDVGAVVLTGSLPRGLAPTTYRELVSLARAAGRPTVLDTSGPALTAALEAGPTLVKPNADELAEAAGAGETSAAAARLREAGAATVVASLGAEGLLALTRDGLWRARPGLRVEGNPTGAGDACVAALADGLHHGHALLPTLERAVSWSAGAVAAPTAGEVDPVTAARVAELVSVRREPVTGTWTGDAGSGNDDGSTWWD